MASVTSLKSPAVLASAAVLFLVSISLSQIPLTNYLGFEFSFVIGVLMIPVSGLIAIGFLRRRFKGDGVVTPSAVGKTLTTVTGVGFTLLMIPLSVISLNTLFVKNCSYGEGLAFFGLLPVVATFFCSMLAGWCAVLFRYPRTIYFLTVIIGGVIYPLWLGYTSPQIFSYNFFYGYFPGVTYDEVLTVTDTLLFSRLFAILTGIFFFYVILFCVEYSSSSSRLPVDLPSIKGQFIRNLLQGRYVAIVVIGTVLIAGWFFRSELGFAYSYSYVQKQLGKQFITDHFEIFYSAETFTEEEIRWAAGEHEFRLKQVQEKLRVPVVGRFASYIHPSVDVKRKFIGAGVTNIAKPWQRAIHLNAESWRDVLMHELVHVVAGEFGMPIIRAHVRPALTEGLAMAVEWNFGNRTPHEYAAAVDRLGLAQDFLRFMSISGFATQHSSMSYVLSGSFCRFLLDRYGAMRLKQVYGGKSFRAVYDKPLGRLFEEWRGFLGRIDVSPECEPHVCYYFDRKSIFARECARYIAKLNSKGMAALRRGELDLATSIFEAALEESWNTAALQGLVRTLYERERYEELVRLMTHQLEMVERITSVANLLIPLGDAHWLLDDIASARETYRMARDFDISQSVTEAATLRLAVLNDEQLRPAGREVLLGKQLSEEKRLILLNSESDDSHPLRAFLSVKVAFDAANYAGVTAVDNRALAHIRSQLPDELKLLLLQMAAISHFRLHQFDRARVLFWEAMNYTANAATRLRLNDWIDRCEWFAG